MIAAWMLYALLVGALVAMGAWGADALLRLAGRPTRWVWAGALLLTIGLVLSAPRDRLRNAELPVAVPQRTTTFAAPTSAVEPSRITRFVSDVRDAVGAPVRRALATAERRLPASSGAALALAWVLVTGAATLVHLAAYRRIGRARRAWPTVDMEGGPVRLARDMGPAVVGLAKPEVVVPRWLLDRPADERRLVLVHEREHVRAHDPLLLAAGCAAAVLLAWHPAAWWMLARLRLAVETDCDRRVLRRGTTTRAYASLLIDLAGHDAGLPAGAPALAGRPTHLERRLIAMTTRTSRFPILRGGALAAVAAAAVLAACESKLPTAAEVASMDVSAVEQKLVVDHKATTEYYVDGVKITPEQARNLAPDAIESVRVLKATMKDPARAAEAPSRIEITTKGAMLPGKVALKEAVVLDSMLPSRRAAPGGRAEVGQRAVLRNKEGIRISDSLIVTHERSGATRAMKIPSDEVPLFVIDDRVVKAEAMHKLAPDAIESVEILKSQAATAAYGAAAKHGVVKVVTRKR